MAENLNYDAEGSKCYKNESENCDKYGRLYKWTTARTVCPSGWHLPSDAEWTRLTDNVGSNAGTKLKAANGWNSDGNGTDDYGFAALPGGNGSSIGTFNLAGFEGYWWSSSTRNTQALSRKMAINYSTVSSHYVNKALLFSVRCVMDD
jgi:uncharacterized protein (TIGR02145 family)